jgi:uncharacterized phage protein gp47/JayE
MTLPSISTADSTGVSLARYSEILEALITESVTKWGDSVDTSEDEFLGHLLRLIATLTAEINEIVQYIYDSRSIPNSEGVPLSNNVAMLGIERASDSASTAVLKLTAEKATTVPAGTLYKTANTELYFATGEKNASIGAINTIVTPVSGISDVTNEAAAVPGRLQQTDAELKVTHSLAVETSGENDAASIYEALALVEGVSAIRVYDDEENSRIHVSVIGGDSEEIAQAISYNKTATIPTFGSTSVVLYDEITSQPKTINYDIAATRNIYIDMVLTKIDGVYPDDGDAQIKAAILSFFENYRISDDVIYTSIYKPIYEVTGVIVEELYIGFFASPSGTSNLTIDDDQLAVTSDSIIGISES